MKHKSLSVTLGGAIAASITLAPVAQAAENPFALQTLSSPSLLAQAGQKQKLKDGKCGEGKCASRKMKQGGCSASKMKQGGCSASKMKEGGCSADKMKEGGCSGNMKMDETAPANP